MDLDTTRFTPTQRRFIERVTAGAKSTPPGLDMVILFGNDAGFLIAASCPVGTTSRMLHAGLGAVNDLLFSEEDPRQPLGDDDG